ncbi:hypothetical protein DYB36_000276 [Aphanomyces astaci]|uniref:Dynein heavy chain linker domain-containing protein n=2 Tax=Aphanomyces astaci TaxID=112090 RepID=A0A397BQ25_APHAT|nr:hypothetical protein DYB36_000276 [Aphanomyces astaci]
MFSIVFTHSGIEKEVFRANLLLPAIDDEAAFLRQRDIYFKETRLIYELIRCERFVCNEAGGDDGDLGVLSLKTKGRITQLAIRRHHITQTLAVHGAMLTAMLRGIDADYASVMRRSKIDVVGDRNNSITTPLHSTLVKAYLRQQRLTHWCHKPQIPHRLLAFSKARDKVMATHLDATRASLHLLHRIMTISQRVLPTIRLFHEIQSDYDAAVQYMLRHDAQWTLQSSMHRFTNRIDYILANDLSQAVRHLACDVEQYPLVEISTADIKATLVMDIHRTMQATLEFLSLNCHHQERRIAEMYDQDMKTLAVPPENEATLDVLWTFLSDVDSVVDDRRAQVDSIADRLSSLDAVGYLINHPVGVSTAKFHWTLRGYPSTILLEVKTCQDACEARKKSLSASLFMEKRAFECDVVRLKDAILVLTTKTEWSKDNVEMYADDAQTLHESVEACLRRLQDFARRDRIFGWTPMESTNVTLLQALLEPYFAFWTTSSDFTTSTTTWSKTPFEQLAAKDVVTKVAAWQAQLRVLTVQLGKQSTLQPAIATLHAELDAFCVGMPIVHMAATGAMKGRHWETIVDLLDVDARLIQDDRLLFTLDDLVRGGILSVLEFAHNVHQKALREFQLEQCLQTLKKDWCKPVVHVDKYLLKDTYVVVNFAPLLAMVDDQLITIYQMRSSDDVDPIKADVDEWKVKLLYTQQLLQTWSHVQQSWRAIECFFYKQKEGDSAWQDFAKVESTWRSVMELVRGNPGLAKIADSDNVKEPLEKCLRMLRSVHKMVTCMLDAKRSAFPKLFMVSNFDLAHILSAQRIQDVPPKLNGLFEGIDIFQVDHECIRGITLKTGDTLVLVHPVACTTPERDGWFVDIVHVLMSVDASIKLSIKQLIATTCQNSDGMQVAYKLDLPLQVILVVLQIKWVAMMEAEMDNQPLNVTGHAHVLEVLLALEKGLIHTIRTGPTDVKVATILAKVVSLVHHTKALAQCSTRSFDWLSQPRRYLHYARPKPAHVIQVLDTEMHYQNEFLCIRQPQSNVSTDKMLYSVFMSMRHLRGVMLQGFHMVHTAVYLTQYIGASLVVEVLSKESTWTTLGHVLKGAAASGSWLLLHRMNDAPSPVLSILTQVMVHFAASHALHVLHLPQYPKAELHPSFALLCTLNSHRTCAPLPTSLSAAFMPCSVVQPCLLQYTMSTLYVFGFT